MPVNADKRIHPISTFVASLYRNVCFIDTFKIAIITRNIDVARRPLNVFRKRLLPFHIPSQM